MKKKTCHFDYTYAQYEFRVHLQTMIALVIYFYTSYFTTINEYKRMRLLVEMTN